jgi:hypothetical protein
VLDWYEQGLMSRDEVLNKLGLKRRRFYTLLKAYRAGTLRSVTPPKRANTHRKVVSTVEVAIRRELETEKRLIKNPDMPVKTYNYAAVRDSVVEKTGYRVSAQTVRNRAKDWLNVTRNIDRLSR